MSRFKPPLGKSGQVAGWTALLDRLGTAAGAEWQDNTGTPFEQIVVDSAATFLEGVVHLDLLLGQVATSCKVALASYASSPGGVLLVYFIAVEALGQTRSTRVVVVD